MCSGTFYFGVAASDVHQSWLQNVLDKEALQRVSTRVHLFEQPMEQHVAQQLRSTCSELNPPDAQGSKRWSRIARLRFRRGVAWRSRPHIKKRVASRTRTDIGEQGGCS